MEKENNFGTELFDIIDLPLFILLGITLLKTAFNSNPFYINNIFYFIGASFLISGFLYGFVGFRAAKSKSSLIKPWIGGLFTALIVSFFSLILSVIMIVYFPTPIGDLNEMYVDSENEESIMIDKENIDVEEIAVNENVETEFSSMGQGGWDDPLLSWTLFGGLIGSFFVVLGGIISSFIGGAIGKE